MKKISIIGTCGIPARYGGFETLAERLVQYLSDLYEISVYCSTKSCSNKIAFYKGARLIYVNLKANGIQSVLYDNISILKAFLKTDSILLLGVSGAWIIPLMRILSKVKFITNIDGIEWKREKWGRFAKYFLKISEKIAVKYSHTVIVDNVGIKEYVEKFYQRIDIHVITYGGDSIYSNAMTIQCESKYYFTVCRIEPENNIHLLLEAFTYLKEKIIIVGNWENCRYSKSLYNVYHTHENISLLSPIYDVDRLNQLRANAYCYLHGHSAGGTNPSLVEAMYLELPVICFDVNFNRYTTHNQAIYFSTSDELKKIIETITDKELDVIKKRMSNIAKKYYSWNLICQEYDKIFDGT